VADYSFKLEAQKTVPANFIAFSISGLKTYKGGVARRCALRQAWLTYYE
jgi:hypothetical protein